MAGNEKMIEVRDEYYRKPEGGIRHRRLINGQEIWNSDANVCFVPMDWPWDRIGVSPLNDAVKAARKIISDPSLKLHLDMMNSENARRMYKAMESVGVGAGEYLFNPTCRSIVKEGPKALVKYRRN